MRKEKGFWSFVNWPLAFWRAFACPLHGECSLSLLVNQFQGRWIPFQVGWWRVNSKISWEINEGVLFSGLISIQSSSDLSPYSLIPSSPFPHSVVLMAHLLEWCLCFADYSRCQRFDVLCMDFYSHLHIICKLKYKKYMYERLPFPMLLNN